jgi:hypothetical protein
LSPSTRERIPPSSLTGRKAAGEVFASAAQEVIVGNLTVNEAHLWMTYLGSF